MPRYPDLGTQFSNSGAAMPTTYTGAGLGAAFQTGAAVRARFVMTITGAAGTTLTSVQCKVQGRDSLAGAWADVASRKDIDGTLEQEHSFAATANSVVAFSFSMPGDASTTFGFADMRLVVKCTGTSIAGDSITITCQAA